MKVRTKYDLGDEVWYMYQNRPMCNKVRYIYVRVNNQLEYSVSYLMRNESGERAEDTLFSTKKELLMSL